MSSYAMHVLLPKRLQQNINTFP